MVRFFGLAGVAGLLLAGCVEKTPEQPAPEDSRLTVYSVNYPLHYFSQRIGGRQVIAVFPTPADVDPALWTPSPDTVAAYQDADLIFLNGAGYARWVGLATLPEARMINTSHAFEDRYIELEATVTHTHGPMGDLGGNHSHTGFALTTWLDLRLAKLQARAITDALIKMRPAVAETFEARFGQLAGELDALDARLVTAAEQLEDTPIVFSHPVYEYLQRRYGLNGRSVHWEPDETPGMRQWRELDELLRTHDARWMVWEAEPAADTQAGLESRGIGSLVFSPVANTPVSGDFLAVMDAQISALETAATGL